MTIALVILTFQTILFGAEIRRIFSYAGKIKKDRASASYNQIKFK